MSADLEDLLGELTEPIAMVESALDDLRTAETVETVTDFRANLETALGQLASVCVQLKDTLEAAK